MSAALLAVWLYWHPVSMDVAVEVDDRTAKQYDTGRTVDETWRRIKEQHRRNKCQKRKLRRR